MSPLTANLKHLYQCRTVMVINLFLLPSILAFPVLLHKISRQNAMPMIFAMFYCTIFSMWVSRLAADIFSKPFSFCLPNHEKTVHRMLLVIWVAMLIYFLLVVTGFCFFSTFLAPGILFGIFGLLSLSYWMGTSILTRAGRFIYFIFIMAIFLGIYNHYIESLLLENPWWVGIFCSIVAIFIYIDLGRGGQGRRLYNKPLPAFSYAGKENDIDFIPKPRTSNKAPSRISFAMSRYFEEKIRSHAASELMVGLWGQLYLLVSTFFNYRNIVVILFILFPFLMFISFQYDSTTLPILSTILSVIASVIGGAACTIHRFEHITLLNRKVLFVRSATATIVSVFVIAGFLGFALFLNNLLSHRLPEVIIMGKTLQIAPVSWITIAFAVPMIPMFGGILVLFKQHLLRSVVLCSTVILVMIFSIVSVVIIERSSPGQVLAGFLFATIITWGFHFSVLYFDSMKRSLC